MLSYNQGDIKISKINTLADFEYLEEAWKKLYAEDEESILHMSWEWLKCLFTTSSLEWFILAFQHTGTGKYIAFAQFTVEQKTVKRLINWRFLRLGAFPLGNYSGLLCKKEFERSFVELLSRYLIEKISWDKFFITHAIDSRVDRLIDPFRQEDYDIERNPHSVSSRIVLPDSWEKYLKEILGKQTRKTFVRLLNRVNENERIRISNVNEKTLDRDTVILFKLWLNKWGAKPHSETEQKIFKKLFEFNRVDLNILWYDQTPIAAQGLIHDRVNDTLYAYITGYDPDYSKLSPGNMIGLYSLKEAINQQYNYYEFYQGEDRYKLNLGAERRFPTTVKITNKKFKTKLIDKLIQLTKK